MRIKELRIENYKIFKNINILFNDNVNIFVGENDSGKTTILEALSMVLTGKINGGYELIIQRAYRDNYGKLPIEDGIDVMSVGGVAFKRYCELAQLIRKNVVIVTDNDGDPKSVKERYNDFSDIVNLCVEEDKSINTLEPAVLYANKDNFEDFRIIIYHKNDIKTIDYEALNKFMENNKAEWSMRVFLSDKKSITPNIFLKRLELPMMNNDVIFAAAGSGKTYNICSKAIRLAAGTSKTILLVTYTNEGVRSLETEYKKQNFGVIDSNVKITTWYSFVLSDFIKPYQCLLNLKYKHYKIEFPYDIPENFIKSIAFYQSENTPKYFNKGHIQYFINGSHDVHKNKVSELAYKCNTDSSGKAIKRLEEIYSHIFFDELQDYAGWDLELLLLLFFSAIPITCVGDYKQATFRTNNSPKNKQYRDDKIKDFFELQQKKGICSITYSKITRRFNQDICNYINTIHGDTNNQVCQCSEIEFQNENSGVYIVEPKYLSDYCNYYNPTILRYDRDSQIPFSHNCQVLNYGNSKGLTLDRVVIIPVGTVLPFIQNGAKITSPQTKSKFYVACTRARHSIVFAIDNFTGIANFKHSEIVCRGEEIPALKYVK